MIGQRSVVGLGEVLWDLYPDAARFGGAPANCAAHAGQLGGDAHVISCVGSDVLGDRAIAELQSRDIGTCAIQRHSDRPTGTVQVTLDDRGTPSYEIIDQVAWDALTWSEPVSGLARSCQAVVFGTLAQRHEPARSTIRRFLNEVPESCLKVLDINLRSPWVDASILIESLKDADVLKLSHEEWPFLRQACQLDGRIEGTAAILQARFGLRVIALTMGQEGAVLIAPDRISRCAGEPVEVRDSVGAGDAYTAALMIGLLDHRDLETINRHACRVAAFVCTQPGATPCLPDELRRC